MIFSELLLIRETIDTPYPLFVWFSVTNETPDNYIDALKNSWACLFPNDTKLNIVLPFFDLIYKKLNNAVCMPNLL